MSKHSNFNNNITFVMLIIDCFSKFLWCFPLKNKEAKTISAKVQDLLLSKSSTELVQTDNGSEFDGLEELGKMYNFKHIKSSAYHPQSQGQIERLNQIIKRSIQSYLLTYDTKNYIDNLKFIVYSYNTSIHTTTKATPMKIHRSKKSELNLLYENVAENIERNAKKMVEDSKKKAKNM